MNAVEKATWTVEEHKARGLLHDFMVAVGELDRIDSDAAKSVMKVVSTFEADWRGIHA